MNHRIFERKLRSRGHPPGARSLECRFLSRNYIKSLCVCVCVCARVCVQHTHTHTHTKGTGFTFFPLSLSLSVERQWKGMALDSVRAA